MLWLNNSAARRIENGEYERATSFLLKALEINWMADSNNAGDERARSRRLDETKPDDFCTLDDCIIYSERGSGSNYSCSRDLGPPIKKKIFQAQPPMLCWTRHSPTTGKDQNDYEDSYIYCQPIQVGDEEVDMRETLAFIIIFNLALAHHLQALAAHYKKQDCEHFVEKARLLYELAHDGYIKLHQQHEDSSSHSYHMSLRFIIIIQNNLCQLFRLVHNHQTFELYRQHLLSTVMTVVEYNTRDTRHGLPSNMGGFLDNIASLVLGEKACAEAA